MTFAPYGSSRGRFRPMPRSWPLWRSSAACRISVGQSPIWSPADFNSTLAEFFTIALPVGSSPAVKFWRMSLFATHSRNRLDTHSFALPVFTDTTGICRALIRAYSLATAVRTVCSLRFRSGAANVDVKCLTFVLLRFSISCLKVSF